MEKKFINPEEIRERERIILIRNEKRHKQVINYLLELLQLNDIDILDENLKDYLATEYLKEYAPNIKDEQIHRDIINYLINTIQSNKIAISNENLKEYLSNIANYDCMWEDYKNHSS